MNFRNKSAEDRVSKTAAAGTAPGIQYPFLRPAFVSGSELDRYLAISRESGYLSNGGPLVGALEKRIAELADSSRTVVVFANATLALMAAMSWLKSVKGDACKIFVPSFTFPPTLQSALWSNLPYRFADIAEDTLCVDASRLDEYGEADALVVTNALSGIGDLDAYRRWAESRGAALIFDSASSYGNTYRGRPLGNFGDIEIFSFHASKSFPFGECGAVFCADEAIERYMRRFKNFGFDSDKEIDFLGLNAKVSEVTAAYGLCILDRYEDIRSHRREMARLYESLLPRQVRIANRELEQCTFVRQFVPVRLPEGADPNVVQLLMSQKGISALRYYRPLHQIEIFKRGEAQGSDLHVTERVWNSLICLPLTHETNASDVQFICSALEEVLASLKA